MACCSVCVSANSIGLPSKQCYSASCCRRQLAISFYTNKELPESDGDARYCCYFSYSLSLVAISISAHLTKKTRSVRCLTFGIVSNFSCISDCSSQGLVSHEYSSACQCRTQSGDVWWVTTAGGAVTPAGPLIYKPSPPP